MDTLPGRFLKWVGARWRCLLLLAPKMTPGDMVYVLVDDDKYSVAFTGRCYEPFDACFQEDCLDVLMEAEHSLYACAMEVPRADLGSTTWSTGINTDTRFAWTLDKPEGRTRIRWAGDVYDTDVFHLDDMVEETRERLFPDPAH
jgi:hypothetical protein